MNKTLAVAAAIGAASILPASLQAQEWTYQSYWEGKPWSSNTIFKLTESGGEYRAEFIQGAGIDDCNRRGFRAMVERQADEQIIALPAVMAGCEERRVVVKNDGTGGRVEVRQADGSWKWDGFERILKRKN